MKQDIGLFDVQGEVPDIVIEDGDLKADNGLETALLISLFSDQRVSKEDLPLGETDQRGWWADTIADPADDKIGSVIWVSDRGKILDSAANDLEDAAKAALAWMIDDGIAAKIEVSAVVAAGNQINIAIAIYRPDGDDIPFKFVWDGQALKLA